MRMLVRIAFILSFIVVADIPARASEMQLVYSAPLPAARLVPSQLIPVVSKADQPAGVVIAEQKERRLYWIDFNGGRTASYCLSLIPGAGLAIVGAEENKYHLYVVAWPELPAVRTSLWLYRLTFDGTLVMRDSVPLPCRPSDGYLVDVDASLVPCRGSDGTPTGIRVSAHLAYSRTPDRTAADGQIATCAVYRLDLGTPIFADEVDGAVRADFDGDGMPDIVSYQNLSIDSDRSHRFTGSALRKAGTVVSAEAASGLPLFTHVASEGTTLDLIAGDFFPDYPGRELVFYGTGTGLDGSLMPVDDAYLACYSLEFGSPEQLWSVVPKVELRTIDDRRPRLVARRHDPDRFLFFDFDQLQITDSVIVEPPLSQAVLFVARGRVHYVGIDGGSIGLYVFDTPASGRFGGSGDDAMLPASLTLYQNQPNPFNGATTIEFESARAQAITLSIFNILGQEVKRLAEGAHGAGIHLAAWDGYDQYGVPQASGIYFARLSTGDESRIIKLIYLK